MMIKPLFLLFSLCCLTACSTDFTPPAPVSWQEIEGDLQPIQQQMFFSPVLKGAKS